MPYLQRLSSEIFFPYIKEQAKYEDQGSLFPVMGAYLLKTFSEVHYADLQHWLPFHCYYQIVSGQVTVLSALM